MFFSKNGFRKILNLKSARAKRMLNYLDFVSIDEKQVTEVHCLEFQTGSQ